MRYSGEVVLFAAMSGYGLGVIVAVLCGLVVWG